MAALETMFLQLRHAVDLGTRLEDGWRVSWLGGWDKYHLFFVVMVVRQPDPCMLAEARTPRRSSACR